MKKLHSIIKKELKENNKIFILREKDIKVKKGVMEEYNIDTIYNVYSYFENVVKFWQEDGLCIIIK